MSTPPRPRPLRRRRGAHERGIALLMVLFGLAVLAAVGQEIRYNSIVELRLATNQRDEVRAYYLARSGLGMARLMLRFQRQLDQIQIPNLAGMLGQLAGGLGGLLGGGQPPAAGGGLPTVPQPQSMSIQLWRMAKIDCYMLQQMVPEIPPEGLPKGSAPAPKNKKFDFDDENPELAKEQGAKSFGGFKGCFDVAITDEEERINLNKLNAPQLSAQVALAQTMAAFGDKKFEFLFEKEDSNRIKVTPQEVIQAMRDWSDEDETGSQINLTGNGEPFQRGFSDENGPYSRYETRYQAKNARFDSLDELYMVHGVNDRFMAAFGDKLTVYPDNEARLNINTDDPLMLELAIRSIADPLRPDPRLTDPIFIDTLIKRIRTARVFALFGMSASDFVNIVQSSGVATNPTILNNVAQNRFIGDKSQTYRLKVTGTAGDVTRTITVVLRLDDGLGRLVYWRED